MYAWKSLPDLELSHRAVLLTFLQEKAKHVRSHKYLKFVQTRCHRTIFKIFVIVLVLLYFAMWLVSSTNKNQTQLWLARTHFPTLGTGCMYIRFEFWLVHRVVYISLLWFSVLRLSNENRSEHELVNVNSNILSVCRLGLGINEMVLLIFVFQGILAKIAVITLIYNTEH